MKKSRNLLPLMVCASMVIHGLFFFIFSANPVSMPRAPKQNQSGEAFSLVNLALAEPALPQPEIPAPSAKEAAAELSTQSSGVLPEPVSSGELPAENFIVLEMEDPAVPEFPPENFAGNSALPVASQSNPVPAPRAGSPGEGSAGSSAQITAYVDRNYNYIQRRIRDKLVYPPQARRTGLQGTVELIFTIHEDGGVSGVRVSSSSGSDLLDAAAVEAIYAAAPFRRPPAQARLAIPVAFRLH